MAVAAVGVAAVFSTWAGTDMAGIFDRLKERFTQNAAGTTDLSSLSEDQQKLLRRQYIGRLGSSLAQTGDFGAGMEAQAKDAQARQAQMLEQQQRAEVANIWGNGSPLNDAQRQLPGVSAPPPPTLSQGAAPQGAAPQQRAAALNDASQKRAYYENVARQLAAAGRGKEAEFALDMAKLFAARETFFAPTSGIVNGEERMFQASDAGGMQILDAAPLATDTTRTARQLGADLEALRTHLAIQNAGADRSSTTVLGPDAAAAAMIDIDAKRLEAYRNDASQAVNALPSVQSAYNALRNQDTGALQNALVPLIRFVNPGSDLAQAQTVAAAGMTPQLLAQLAGIGGSDTVREVELMLANLPSTANPAETNMKLFEVILAGTQRRITDAQNAERVFYDQGGSLRGFVPQGNSQFDIFNNQFQQDRARQQTPGTSRRAGLGLEYP